MNLPESFVGIRQGRYQGRPFFHGAVSGFPIKWVSPTVVLIPRTPGLFENLKKTNCSLVVLLLSESLRKKREPHGIVGVSDWKSLRFPEKLSSRGDECLAKYHRRHRQSSQQRPPVVKRLCASPNVACEEALVIERNLSVAIQPADE